MPNWIRNELRVTGLDDDIDRFRQAMLGPIPEPEDDEHVRSSFGGAGIFPDTTNGSGRDFMAQLAWLRDSYAAAHEISGLPPVTPEDGDVYVTGSSRALTADEYRELLAGPGGADLVSEEELLASEQGSLDEVLLRAHKELARHTYFAHVDASQADLTGPGGEEREALSLAALMPPPPGLDDTRLLMWAGTHWGCKWDVVETRRLPITGGYRYEFDSANDPPLPWARAMARWFPELDMTFGSYDPDSGIAFALVLTSEEMHSAEGAEGGEWFVAARAAFTTAGLPWLAECAQADIDEWARDDD